MADDKNKQGRQDDQNIDPNDPSELQYAAKSMGSTPEDIRSAIAVVGTNRAKVAEYISKRSQEKR